MIARFTWRAALLVLTLATTLGLAPARAEGDEFDARGPAKVQIGKDLATLNLPKGYVYFGEAKARALMEQMGSGDKDVLAFIMPDQKEANFGILIGFEDTGYVKDDDAGKIDAKAILESYQEGTEAQNEARKSKGLGELHVTGWDQEPSYDPKTHVVLWSLQGENQDKEQFVNYNTRVLGRKGVLSINLMCDNKDLAAAKPRSQDIVKAIAFNQGQRYEDYQQGDKISTGGLVALIAGGALLAKKTGVLAFIAVMFKPLLLLLKAGGAKLLILGAALLGGIGKAIFGKKNQD